MRPFAVESVIWYAAHADSTGAIAKADPYGDGKAPWWGVEDATRDSTSRIVIYATGRASQAIFEELSR